MISAICANSGHLRGDVVGRWEILSAVLLRRGLQAQKKKGRLGGDYSQGAAGLS